MIFFEIGKNKIAWLGHNFQAWFSGVEVSVSKKAKLYSKVLEKPMLDKEILEELKPSELTLGEVAYAIKNILKKDDWAIFYVKDKDNTLRAVFVFWNDDGWGVGALPVADPDGWGVGARVFSRNSFYSVNLSASDTLFLERRVSKLEEDIKKLKMIINI